MSAAIPLTLQLDEAHRRISIIIICYLSFLPMLNNSILLLLGIREDYPWFGWQMSTRSSGYSWRPSRRRFHFLTRIITDYRRRRFPLSHMPYQRHSRLFFGNFDASLPERASPCWCVT
jgi:hypothetical protein